MTAPLYIDRRKAGLRIRDVFFTARTHTHNAASVDLLYFLQSPTPEPGATDFYTSLIDLRESDTALFDGMHKTVRYETRRARDKDGLASVFCDPPPSKQTAFFEFYDAFASSRGLPPVNRTKLVALSQAGALRLAWVPDPSRAADGSFWLCAHAYIVDGQRARLYHSASPSGEQASSDRQRIGRANKLLHWDAIQHFKSQGFTCYDMGGISMGETLKAIDDFKRSFGGELVREFNCVEAVSLKGRLALALLKLKTKLRDARSSGLG